MSNTELKEKVDALNRAILDGRIMEAMHEFYSSDVVMAENDSPPTVGLEANLQREQEFVDNTTWHALELKGVALGENLSMVHWRMDFTNAQYGPRMAFSQVAVQRWRGGKIYDERFYYTPTVVQ